jgi:hypothetical protein
MIWLLLAGLAVAENTGSEQVLEGIPVTQKGPLSSAQITLSIDVAVEQVDGVPMTSARSAGARLVLVPVQGEPVSLEHLVPTVSACRFRLPLRGPWVPGAEVQVQVQLTGDALPISLKPHLPLGAVQTAEGWTISAPDGDLVVDLPACT